MKPATTDDIFDLIDSSVASAALGAALELGLFWLLAAQPADVAGIAQTLEIPKYRCQYWLQVLDRIGLVKRVDEGYIPSLMARTAILDAFSQETWSFLAGEARDRFPATRDLALHLREPGSAWAAQGLTPPDYFAQISQDPEQARRFTRMLYEIHLPLAEELAQSLNMNGVDRLMDLGGGSGVVSLALLRRYPQLTSVVIDIPNVSAAGREIALESSIEERVTYSEADFLRDELPTGFDVVLQCDVGAYSEELFRKLRSVLNPGGRLVIVGHFATEPGVVSASWVYWAFLASMNNPDFALLTAAEIQSRLTAAGFRLHSVRALPHREVLRWSEDWTIIEAHPE